MVMTGSVGAIMVSYIRAASIRSWSLAPRSDVIGMLESMLTGRVVDADPYWSIHKPTSVRLMMGTGVWWVWQRVEMMSMSEMIPGSAFVMKVEGNPQIITVEKGTNGTQQIRGA